MGVDYDIKWNVVCPKCGTLNKIDEFFDIFRLPYVDSPYGDDYVLRCRKCKKQLIRVRVG